MDPKKIENKQQHISSEQIMIQNAQKSFSHIQITQDQNKGEWRSLTPDRPGLHGGMGQKKGTFANAFATAFGGGEYNIYEGRNDVMIITTEPNDSKKVIKSLSQDSNLNENQNISHGKQSQNQNQSTQSNSTYYFNSLNQWDQKEQQQQQKSKSHSNMGKLQQANSIKQTNKEFKQIISANKLKEIGQQINAILCQNRKNPTQAQRPQSQFEITYDGIKKAQQFSGLISNLPSGATNKTNNADSSIQINSVNSTNLHGRRQNYGFESLIEDLKRGTETERGYQKRQQQMKSQISDGIKQTILDHYLKGGVTQKVTPYKSHKEKITQKIVHRSVNVDFQPDRSASHLEKRTGFSSEQSSQSKYLYQQYLKTIQKKRLSQKSPAQQEKRGIQNSCIDLWSSEKQDSHPPRQASYYASNQQSYSKSSVRRQDERLTQEQENSKSENTTSRNHNINNIINNNINSIIQSNYTNNKVIISNYVNDRTPTKNLFGNIKNYQSPRVSSSKINSLLSSLIKFNRSSAHSNEKNQVTVEQNDISYATQIQDDPDQTHIIISCKDFSVRLYDLQNKKAQLIGRHNRAITCISNVLDLKQAKIFVSADRESVVKVWTNDILSKTYKLSHQFRIINVALFLLIQNPTLYIITSTHIIPYHEFQKKGQPVAINGTIQDVKLNQYNELVLVNSNKLYKLRRNELVLQYENRKIIFKELCYFESRAYVLCANNKVLVFDEGVKLKLNNITVTDDQRDQLFQQSKDEINHFNKYIASFQKKKT